MILEVRGRHGEFIKITEQAGLAGGIGHDFWHQATTALGDAINWLVVTSVPPRPMNSAIKFSAFGASSSAMASRTSHSLRPGADSDRAAAATQISVTTP